MFRRVPFVESDRFDTLARILGSVESRRGLGVLLLGGTLLHPDAVDAKKGKKPRKPKKPKKQCPEVPCPDEAPLCCEQLKGPRTCCPDALSLCCPYACCPNDPNIICGGEKDPCVRRGAAG
jgi:hypothetical protein